MSKEIFIVVKIYSGGRIDTIEAYTDEEKARLAASQFIERSPSNFHIALWTTKLIES